MVLVILSKWILGPFDCMITVVLPPGISKIRRIFAITPTWYRSANPGSSKSPCTWHTTAIACFFLYAALTSFKVLGRPIVTGMTTDGNMTILRKGIIGISFSNSIADKSSVSV